MKVYILVLLCIFSIGSDVVASSNVVEASTAQNNDEPEISKENNIAKIIDEIAILKAKIDSMENDIKNLSSQIKNIEKTPEINNKINSQISYTNLKQKNYDGEKKDYDLALSSLKDGDYAIAEQKFTKFINDYPDSSLLSNVYFWYGELFYKQKNFEKAGIYFLNGYRKFPRGIKASDSLLKLSLSLGRLDKSKEACKIIEKLQKEFKDRSSSSMQKEKEIIEKYNCPK